MRVRVRVKVRVRVRVRVRIRVRAKVSLILTLTRRAWSPPASLARHCAQRCRRRWSTARAVPATLCAHWGCRWRCGDGDGLVFVANLFICVRALHARREKILCSFSFITVQYTCQLTPVFLDFSPAVIRFVRRLRAGPEAAAARARRARGRRDGAGCRS